MTHPNVGLASPVDQPQSRPRLYYGWLCLLIAAVAMVATLPGRTLGLGAITESVIADLRLTPAQFGLINLWATLIGSAFCLGVGRLIDKAGARTIMTAVGLALGGVVLATALVRGYWTLLAAVTLTRGLGQSALSVVSITVVGKWFLRRVGPAMAVYTVFLSIGFMIAAPLLEYTVRQHGWRWAWTAMGAILLFAFVPLAALLLRSTPESVGLLVDSDDSAPHPHPRQPPSSSTHATPVAAAVPGRSSPSPPLPFSPSPLPPSAPAFTFREALRTATFWSLASSGLIFSAYFNGFVLFRESVLAERNLGPSTVLYAVAALSFAGLAANFAAGWASGRWPMGRVAAASMALLAASAAALPHCRTPAAAVMCATLIGLGAGGMTVVFFGSWGPLFGRPHLGRIQGVAQFMTVLGTALGPLALVAARQHLGSYAPAHYTFAAVHLAAAAWVWRAAGHAPGLSPQSTG